MTTLSVPLTPELEKFVNETAKQTGSGKADVMRQALKLYSEEMAVRKIILASTEPSLEGDLEDLMEQVN
tara:strand:+ start:8867 stop:9073 length:207 start_codon:yes stop_codon:yes gene_type:complete